MPSTPPSPMLDPPGHEARIEAHTKRVAAEVKRLGIVKRRGVKLKENEERAR